jgi:cytoskeletal protein CcmA (bactofilin family)
MRGMSKEEINAFLGAGTVYQGRLSFQGAVRIDGSFSGEVQTEGSLIVGKDALIEGVLNVGDLLLAGRFTGEVQAKRRVTIHKTGVLQGVIYTPALVTEEGGLIDGQIIMQGNPPAAE